MEFRPRSVSRLPIGASRPAPGYNGAARRRGAMGRPGRVTEFDSLGPLLEATAQGDRQAFARIYQLSSARLFAIALRVTRRRTFCRKPI